MHPPDWNRKIDALMSMNVKPLKVQEPSAAGMPSIQFFPAAHCPTPPPQPFRSLIDLRPLQIVFHINDPVATAACFDQGKVTLKLHDDEFCGERNSTYRVCNPKPIPNQRNDPLILRFRFPNPEKTGNEKIFQQVSSNVARYTVSIESHHSQPHRTG